MAAGGPTNKQVFVSYIRDELYDAFVEYPNPWLPFDDITAALGEEEVETAETYKDYALALQSVANSVLIDVIANSAGLTGQQLVDALDNLPSVKEFYSGAACGPPTWTDMAKVFQCVKILILETFESFNQERYDMLVNWIHQFLDDITPVMSDDFWDELLAYNYDKERTTSVIFQGNKNSPDEPLPLVGCSCGAANTLIRNTPKCSTCTSCNRHQCLVCGDEFVSRRAASTHLSKSSNHETANRAVTSQFTNYPANVPRGAPELDDNIQILNCPNPCPGTSADAFKVNQYVSKCKICNLYNCLVCGFIEGRKGSMQSHLKSRMKHGTGPLDIMAPVDPAAVALNKRIVDKRCEKCNKSGVAVVDAKFNNHYCKYCKARI